jgi:hypothetical protein
MGMCRAVARGAWALLASVCLQPGSDAPVCTRGHQLSCRPGFTGIAAWWLGRAGERDGAEPRHTFP